MNFRALELLEQSWKSPGNLFLKKGTNPVRYLVKDFLIFTVLETFTEKHSLRSTNVGKMRMTLEGN